MACRICVCMDDGINRAPVLFGDGIPEQSAAKTPMLPASATRSTLLASAVVVKQPQNPAADCITAFAIRRAGCIVHSAEELSTDLRRLTQIIIQAAPTLSFSPSRNLWKSVEI